MMPRILFCLCLMLSLCCCSKSETDDPQVKITLNKSSLTLAPGGSERLSATLEPEETSVSIEWSSSDEKTVRVSPTGIVTALQTGKAQVKAIVKGTKAEASCLVTVSDRIIPVEGISLQQSTLEITDADTYELKYTIKPSNATDKSVLWSASNPSIASVTDAGVVKGIKSGNCIITVTTTDGAKKAQCLVTVRSSDREITSNGKSGYRIVYEKDLEQEARELGKAFKALTGAEIEIQPDSSAEAELEILVGKTSRKQSASLLNRLGSDGWGISLEGKRLAICGTEMQRTVQALFRFEQQVLNDPTLNSAGTLKLKAGFSLSEKNGAPLMFSELLNKGIEFTVKCTHIINAAPVGEYYVAQGAASDGKSVYFVLRNSTDTGCVIRKFDLQTKADQGTTATPFSAGHCNDMTFDDDNNRVILAHGSTEGKILTEVNSQTLEKVKDFNISVGSGAITYNTKRKKYAISQGGSTLHFADANFSNVKSYSRTDSYGYTAQGMGSDDDYIYFPMSPVSGKTEANNILVVYDWNAKLKGKITIPLTIESETMFSVNGRFYVGFYVGGSQRGAALYQIEPQNRYLYVR